MIRKTPLASAVGLALAGAAITVYAQTQEASNDDDIIVVGTRIQRNENTSAAPVDIVAADTAVLQGINDVAELLQTTTVAAGSPQITPAISSGFVENGGAGAQTLSLRGLGANRTLVLLNNRRAGPAGVRGGVSAFDLNILPLSAIERVEVLKDGASSIYGSDAVAGVVNIVTRKDSGGSVDAYHSAPSEGGGEETRLNFSWGQEFDRGYFRLTGDLYEKSELAKGQRDYFRCAEQYIFDPVTGARTDVIDPRTGSYLCADLRWGQVWIYDYQADGNVPPGAKAQFDYDGDLGNYISGFAVDPNEPDYMVTPPGWFPVNYDRASDGVTNWDHPFQDQASLVPRTERSTLMAEGEFDIDDDLHGYAEVLLNRRKTMVNDYRQFWAYIYNGDSGGFLGANPLNAGWTGAQWLSPTAITDHDDSIVEVNYQRFVVGLKGEFAGDWQWDISYQFSESDGDYFDDQIYDDSIWDQNALLGSCAGVPTSVRGVPCVDIPWLDPDFLRGNVSPEVAEFLFGVERGNTVYEQKTLEAYVTGMVGDLPAGPIGVAFGVQLQDDEIRDVPGEITLADNAWNTTTADITAGEDSTTAFFAEFEVPLVYDRAFAEALTLNLSGRHTDVDSYGSDATYKVGLNWQINDSWRVRMNRGTSFRSPALFELYLADQTGFVGQRFIDPCIGWGEALAAGDITQRLADNCAADPAGLASDFAGGGTSALVISGGGLGRLEAETSTSTTFGVVWQPRFADLSVSVDYFDIEVDDEVTQIGATEIVYGCYNSDFFPNEPLCDLFDRTGLDNGIDNVVDDFINVAKQTNTGVDVSAIWRTDLPWGVLTIETQQTVQNEDVVELFSGTVIDTNGEVGQPERVGRYGVSVSRGPWSAHWNARYIGSSSNVASFGGNTTTYRGDTVNVVLNTDSIVYHALSATREFAAHGIVASFGIANAFDEEPPRLTTISNGLGEVYTEGNSAFYSQYDWLGRRYYLNFTKNF